MHAFLRDHRFFLLFACLILLNLLAGTGCSDDSSSKNNTPDVVSDDTQISSDIADAQGTGDVEELCLNPNDCDEFYYCKSDADCDFLLTDLPECSTAICEPDSNTCSVHEDPTPGCKEEKPDNTICEVSGAAGDIFTCSIEVVRTNSDVPGPVFLTGDIHYPSNLITFQGFSDRPCADESCETEPVPPATLHPTNHTLTLNPADVDAWEGVGVFSIYPPEDDEYAYMTDAYIGADGSVAGESQVVDIQFRINIPILTPVWVTLANPTAQGLPESSLFAEVVDHQVIVDGAPVDIPVIQKRIRIVWKQHPRTD